MKRLALCCALAGCRLGFDDVPRDAMTNATSDAVDGATTITFGERSTSQHTLVTYDTYLLEPQPDDNVGLAEDLAVAVDNTLLLRFDLAELAPGTPVAGGRIELVQAIFGDEVDGQLVAHVVSEAWVEGTGPPTNDGASWNNRDVATLWSTPGGTPGALVTSFAVTAPTTNIPLPASLVQAWVDGPATNEGIMIRVSEMQSNTHYHFHASDSELIDLCPQLVIELAP